MFPCFKRFFVDDALIPQSLHLTVGSIGEETRKNLFQLYQVGLGVETCHRAQQFELRRIERLSDSCFHNRIFFIFSTRKILFFSAWHHRCKNILDEKLTNEDFCA